MAVKHRATMGDLPTLPQTFSMLAFPLVQMQRYPVEVQMMVLSILTKQVLATVLAQQMRFTPRPVV